MSTARRDAISRIVRCSTILRPRSACIVSRPYGLTIQSVVIMSQARVPLRDAETASSHLAILVPISSVMTPILNLSISTVVIVMIGLAAGFTGLLMDCWSVMPGGRGAGWGSVRIWVILSHFSRFVVGRGSDMGPWDAVVDFIKATSRWRRAKLTGGTACRTIQDHAGGSSAALQAPSTRTSPGGLGIAVHTCGVSVRVPIVTEISKASRGFCGGVVAAAAACEAVSSVDTVTMTWRLDNVSLSDQLCLSAAVVDAVDLLMALAGLC